MIIVKFISPGFSFDAHHFGVRNELQDGRRDLGPEVREQRARRIVHVSPRTTCILLQVHRPHL